MTATGSSEARAATPSPELERRVGEAISPFAVATPARATAHLLAALALFGAGLVAVDAALGELAAGWLVARNGGGWARLAAPLAGLTLATAVQSLVYVKLFLIHHDLTHGCFFGSRRLDAAGALLAGTLVSTSPSVWKREHDRHHRHSNDLDHPQDGQTASWTVARYLGAPPLHRLLYRAANHPFSLLAIVPPAYFLGFMRVRGRLHENLAFAGLAAVLWQGGLLAAYLLPLLPASALGFLLFHAQHTFAGVYRSRGSDWSFFANGMRGASRLVVPDPPVFGAVLRFFLHGVEHHNLHHLRPGIPGHRLASAERAAGELLAGCPRVTLAHALAALRLSLYDEDAGRLVSFREVAARQAAAARLAE